MEWNFFYNVIQVKAEYCCFNFLLVSRERTNSGPLLISSFLLNSIRTPRKRNLPTLLKSLLKILVIKPKANKVAALISRAERKRSSMVNVASVAFQDIARPIVSKTPRATNMSNPSLLRRRISRPRRGNSEARPHLKNGSRKRSTSSTARR